MSSSSEPTWIYQQKIKIRGERCETSKGASLKENQGPNDVGPHKQGLVVSIAFLADAKQVVGCFGDKFWYLAVEDGSEVGAPIDTKDWVLSAAVSEDGKWIVAGTNNGDVIVWDAKSRKQLNKFAAAYQWLFAVDLSPDATKIATGSDDNDVCVWSLSTGKRLHCIEKILRLRNIRTVKFAPDGCLLAVASSPDVSYKQYIGVYDVRDGHLVVKFKIYAPSIAWLNDSTKIFALSDIGNIHCFDITSQTTLSIWPTHSSDSPHHMCLAPNGTFIVASAGSSASFWDTVTHQQIGSLIHHLCNAESMAISTNYDLVIGGNKNVSLWNLCDILPSPYIDDGLRIRKMQSKMVEACPEETVRSFLKQGVHSDANRGENNQKDHEKVVLGSEQTMEELHAESQQKIDSLTKVLQAHHQKHQCETLFADGHFIDAAKSLLEAIKSTSNDSVKADMIIMEWLPGFSEKCTSALERIGDEALAAEKHDEALYAYATALSVHPSSPNALSTKWASTMLSFRSINEALQSANEFKLQIFPTFRAICDVLVRDGRITEAIAFFRQIQIRLSPNKSVPNERVEWELGFRRRCTERLEKLVDIAFGSQNYDDANAHYSTMLALDPLDRADTLIKRSKVRVMMELWEDALKDANEVIKLDPSSHLGYEQKHNILYSAGRHEEAVAVFDMMLSKLEESPDEHIRELRSQYTDARPEIRGIVRASISHMPQVLIDTTTGHLLDKADQAEAFEADPIFNKLVLSMTTRVDIPRIRREVKKFYRYVMFSHRWQRNEPRYKDVKNVTVYNLKISTGTIKLQTFCSLVRSLGFRWAWSDTCCIDQENNVVLQESLVAMFTWYRGSSLTIIYLVGVSSLSKIPGGLQNSIWNTRAWTYQEYVAAEIVQFYTEDWKPYLELTLSNHKESELVVSEMERASRFSVDQLAVLRPGLERVREKLYMASKRETTRVEDIAYSLLGIFNVSIPVIYGEGTRAVGRFLEHILTGSGDVTILAWTGMANVYNSCLPLNLSVYDPLVPPHIPHMETAELDEIVTELRTSIPDLSLATTLHDLLNKLPLATLVSSRLHLPCIIFHVKGVVQASEPDEETGIRTYRAATAVLGDVEIKTTSELGVGYEHCFVHPWIRPFLGQEYARGTAGLDKTTRALRLAARLSQPFGALLLEKVSRVEYRRVAADSLIMVRVRDEVPLTDLIDDIEMVDVQ